MTYNAPVTDMKFAMQYIAKFDEILKINKFSDYNFELAETILDEASKIAENVISPLNHFSDKNPAVHNADGSVLSPKGFKEAYQELAKGGWTAMEADSKWGGQNMPMILSAAVNEMWHSASMSFALVHLLTQGQIYALQKSASEEQKNIFIPPMLEGRWTATMNLTEPQAGTDLSAIKTTAVKDGNHYRIKGQKIYITYGEHDISENIIHLVLAKTPNSPEGVKGISVFIVPKILVNEDGTLGKKNDIKCLSIEKKLGIKGSPTAVLQYGENEGAIGYLVGKENMGLEIMFGMMNHARFAVGLQGLSISERSYQQAVDFANQRVQGVPIGGKKGDTIIDHPDVLRILSVMNSEIEAMRSLLLVGGHALDKANYSDENDRKKFETRASLLIPIIKGLITERSVEITSSALQVHGGMGFIEETGAAQHFRDSRILPIYEGTTAIQANDLVFRKTLRDNGQAVKELLSEIENDMKNVKDKYSKPVKETIKITEDTLNYILKKANEPRQIALNGVNWLMQLGFLCGGWLMAKSAHICKSYDLNEYSVDFIEAKVTSAEIYISNCLPLVKYYSEIIRNNEDTILKMKSSWLSKK